MRTATAEGPPPIHLRSAATSAAADHPVFPTGLIRSSGKSTTATREGNRNIPRCPQTFPTGLIRSSGKSTTATREGKREIPRCPQTFPTGLIRRSGKSTTAGRMGWKEAPPDLRENLRERATSPRGVWITRRGRGTTAVATGTGAGREREREATTGAATSAAIGSTGVAGGMAMIHMGVAPKAAITSATAAQGNTAPATSSTGDAREATGRGRGRSGCLSSAQLS
mmetsp:Transcript_13748/g.31421  ORF Transcript_13748/g.31421 Transcript_13748/m.31421 type:complete len:225 (-) Transcript_13748:1310-1984(-)